jgi:hypothetical protein
LAAAIDMIAAGTSAPMPIAANARPANQSGKFWSNSIGMIVFGSGLPVALLVTGVTPAAIAANPSSAISPSSSEKAGNADMFRLITPRLPAASIPVTACGYRNTASADPRASVAKCSWLSKASSSPSFGLGDSANFASAASKMPDQPSSLIGRYRIATNTTR